MAEAKQKPTPSPVGTFIWPKLHEPDTKFKDAGEYTVKLRLSQADADAFIQKHGLDVAHADAEKAGEEEYKKLPVATRKKKGNEFKVNPLYTEVYDEETEEPTGEVDFNFKTLAGGVSKKTGKPWSRKVDVFNAKRERMDPVPPVGSGTKGRVAFTHFPYFTLIAGAGLSLRLESAQILDLVAFGSRTADSYGFDDEDGYDGDGSEFGGVIKKDDDTGAAFEDDGDDEDGDDDDF